jgi:hypothetical protein
MLTGCGLQSNCILVMTTFDGNGVVTTQTVIQGFRNKAKCQFAGEQWRNAMGTIRPLGNFDRNPFEFACLEPK